MLTSLPVLELLPPLAPPRNVDVCAEACDEVEANRSAVRDLTERSNSYTDSDWIGDEMSCSVERSATAVMLGHSRNNPVWEG